NRTSSNYGLAIDVGTTTIAVLLVDLISGKILGRASGLNKQITYGEELIPRIAFAGEPEGLQKLQLEAVKSINDIVDRLTSRVGVKNEEITDVCVGGNTVMNHLLAGIDPTYLSMADVKVSRSPIIRKSGTLGIHANPEAYVYCLPNVSRFLGGDAVGDVTASGMYDSDELSLMVDMGTNGEIIFGNKSWLVSCSCASGPAFEGEGIKFGMRAMRGGIEHVKIDPKSFEAEYTVIGNTLPKGICGSGIIDLAAEMFSVGILDFAGKIVKGRTPLVRKGRDGLEYVVVPAEKTAIGRDIVITQRDMDYIMDSKAAACGAITVLMKKLKLSIYDVQNLYLAGAFGAYTDLRNATKLGIFPEFPNAKIRPIGNGSLSGAYATLLSMEKRNKAKAIAENMVYIDLLVDVEFTEK
ncbi:ATP-binding protein, partial [Candidatus Bathyarchaeota archaeon]|nr:ATP-binding protein [Candidatus Bathyarchaeota archaeon]